MGWRDINMSRRKPPLRLAVVPMEEGENAREAVLRKAARAALNVLAQAPVIDPDLQAFAAGYLAGYARHQALKHGIDAEKAAMEALSAALSAETPASIGKALASLRFSPRKDTISRAAMRAEPGQADAGYLVGQLASLCGSEKLLAVTLAHLAQGDVDRFLTACDVAADRLQTHQPTMALRFTVEEREILRKALS
jgi:hypothetical protein